MNEEAKKNSTCLDLLLEDLEAAANTRPDPDKCGQLELKKWLFEKRLEYARNFFDHHAKQRMTMFNFFLIFVAFVVSGYATLSKDGPGLLPTALALIAGGLTIIFLFLDRRNEELVHVTEDVLASLESDVLFAKYDRAIEWPKRRGWWGRMLNNKDPEPRPLGIFRRQTADDHGEGHETTAASGVPHYIAKKYASCNESKYQHGKWLPVFQISIFIMFLVLAIFPWAPKLIGCFCSLLGAGK